MSLDLSRWRMSRRALMRSFGAGAVGALGMTFDLKSPLANPLWRSTPFTLGIASGDPSADGFVIWTRLAPDPFAEDYGMPIRRVEVQWEVGADPQMREIVQKGIALAHPELGHAVHVEISGLAADRPYWYRFICGTERSFTGKTKTLPASGAPTPKLRLAVAGCQNYTQGLFTAYRHLARAEPDLVFHYGDYIYEGSSPELRQVDGEIAPTVRRHHGQEIYTLSDYRRRYAQYKMDADLQTAHAAAPWFFAWDDHEIDNNWASDIDQDNTDPNIFRLRRIAAAQAYYEAMPMRMSSFPVAERIQLFRRAEIGDLATLHVLDTRQYRSNHACEPPETDRLCAAIRDEKRTILGERQEAWLKDGLAAAKTRWNPIAQQVMVMDYDRDPTPVQALNTDAWAGYHANRQRLLDHLHQQKIRNAVVLTGDVHQNFAGDIRLTGDKADAPIVASEFVATSIASGGDGVDQRPGAAEVLAQNPHVQFNNSQRGFLLCELSHNAFVGRFMVMDRVATPGGAIMERAAFAVEAGKPGLQKA